jgi:hypothetical protein
MLCLSIALGACPAPEQGTTADLAPPAPPSPCSDKADAMVDCFAGSCEKCWIAGMGMGQLACAEGRTCCTYVCLD